MEEEFKEDLESQSAKINEENLISKIWLHPTATLKFILNNCPEKYVTILLVLGGIVRAISRASNKNLGDKMPTLAVLGMAILLGGLLGWIAYYIYAWAMSVTGEWLGGKSNPIKFRTIIAWALVPSIATLILLVPEVIILGDDLFKSEITNDSMINTFSWLLFGLLELTLGIWTVVILVKGTSLIQNFGIGKSILNMILPGLIFIVPILLIGFLIGMVN